MRTHADKHQGVGEFHHQGITRQKDYVLLRVDHTQCLIQVRNGDTKYLGRTTVSFDELRDLTILFAYSEDLDVYTATCVDHYALADGIRLERRSISPSPLPTKSTISQLVVFIPIYYYRGHTGTHAFLEQIIVYDCSTKTTRVSSTNYGDSKELASSDLYYFTALVTETLDSFQLAYHAPNAGTTYKTDIPKIKGFQLIPAHLKHHYDGSFGTTRDLKCFQF